MDSLAQHAVLGVRLVGLLVLLLGLWQLAGNIIDTWRDFDPSYITYYFSSQIARPLAGILIGLLVIFVAAPTGRLLARGLRN